MAAFDRKLGLATKARLSSMAFLGPSIPQARNVARSLDMVNSKCIRIAASIKVARKLRPVFNSPDIGMRSGNRNVNSRMRVCRDGF